ncbi:hypothetical protein VNO77_36127 [Canavalia gladiata]|uniref:3-ketoacyl-CoA synthase n=1 Tax=Canavalia gladiata TaxID=3824 RepID=A0AAN9K9E2_CANGL
MNSNTKEILSMSYSQISTTLSQYTKVIKQAFVMFLIPVVSVMMIEAYKMKAEDIHNIWLHVHYNLLSFVVCNGVIILGMGVYMMSPRSIYLVDFSCYKPPSHLKVDFSLFMHHSTLTGNFTPSSLEFQRKILERSGLGEETYLPQALHNIPPTISMAAARDEAKQVMFGVLDDLFANTNVRPEDVGILVVNCSLFNPTPSLAAMIVNKYKMKSNVKSFSLGGMGCSAGVIAIDIAKDMLQLNKNTYAVVVSTESVTQNWYFGNDKSMLLPNCLFRSGGAAILLSNKASDWTRAKYKLVHVVRTQTGADDKAFEAVTQREDDAGKIGVSLSRDLMVIAGEALKTNITTLAPLVLPIKEQYLFLYSLVIKKLFNSRRKLYTPNFKLAFDHFCIHGGGRAVLDEIEKNLQLQPEHIESSRMALHRFGNTSSSSIWYELAYTEAKHRVKKGNKVWQIALGSGFKCNSVVWKALTHVEPSPNSPWKDCIHRYPVYVGA